MIQRRRRFPDSECLFTGSAQTDTRGILSIPSSLRSNPLQLRILLSRLNPCLKFLFTVIRYPVYFKFRAVKTRSVVCVGFENRYFRIEISVCNIYGNIRIVRNVLRYRNCIEDS